MAFFKRMLHKKNKTEPMLASKKALPSAPQQATTAISNKVALGAGCYWGTEKYIRKNFQDKFPNSIKSATVGFMAPADQAHEAIRHPTYQQVCTGASGHVEVLLVELNEPEKHFEELIRFFFQFHDPTTQNRQGNDIGFQYASYIFCDNDEQQTKIAERVRDELQTLLDQRTIRKFTSAKVTTLIARIQEFTPAHDEHQRYLEMNPNGYCNHRIFFKQWPALTTTTKAAGAATTAAFVEPNCNKEPSVPNNMVTQ